MAVESWDPAATGLQARHRDILNRAVASLETGSIELNDDEQAWLRPAMQLDAAAWQAFSTEHATTTLVAWIKILTLVERDLSGFEAGSRSPVLALLKVLKARNEVPPDLFAWIRSHTTNRFLPYGSLADRL
ncbi:MAG: hypothetical protein F4W90_06260 [Gammaproteobacteria bacterium]|nr:hypothetical protein [Gammaproteobacteria bacterium]